ncbi:hypothetical protein ElyMa_006572700 [Elysia marginata]|uniref:DUF4136 domain-containing protein n=1 Tax=Elysia marginata TaxID=1093978 RepID=A0AAV4IGB9_9GAST|nr:hypothetical protein ElyMa_006572700 [Elysia marginata]
MQTGVPSMKLTNSLVAAVLLMLLSACTVKPQVNWDYDPQVNWSNLKTWAWMEPKGKFKERMIHGFMNQRVHHAVEQDMALKGLKEIAAKDADIWLSWGFTTKRRLEETRYNAGFSWYPYPWMMSSWPTETIIDTYQEGYLTLNMINPKTKNLVWQGVANHRITGSMSPTDKRAYITSTVDRLLSAFPPDDSNTL